MTSGERAQLKALVDAARRVVVTAVGPTCAHCTAEFQAAKFQTGRQKYCSRKCRKAAWGQTDKGRAWFQARDRTYRGRRPATEEMR